MRRWDPSFGSFASPFELVNRMTEEMDRWFDRMTRDVGLSPRLLRSRAPLTSAAGEGMWWPRVDAIQKEDKFIVRADLPGLKKDDVEVDLTDDAIIIRGERRQERQEEREGFRHSEREYGQFYRMIPLPEGVDGESAQATFHDGVLEITMKAPSEANRGRKLEIKETSESAEAKK